jgi:hypothetical protein
MESPAVERRAFLRQLTGEAVVTSARLAGLSSAVRQSLFAAVEATATDVGPAGEPAPTPPITSAATREATPMAPPAPATHAARPVVPVTPVALSPRQEALLTNATIAVLGTSALAGAPHLTASRFHWDGSVVRLSSDLFSARVARIDADPRVSLLIADEGPDEWVAIDGTAAIVSGDAVAEGIMPILRKYMTDEAAERAWTQLRASENPVVIEIRPSGYVWRLR